MISISSSGGVLILGEAKGTLAKGEESITIGGPY